MNISTQLVGKTIKSCDFQTPNLLEIHFTDGTWITLFNPSAIEIDLIQPKL